MLNYIYIITDSDYRETDYYYETFILNNDTEIEDNWNNNKNTYNSRIIDYYITINETLETECIDENCDLCLRNNKHHCISCKYNYNIINETNYKNKVCHTNIDNTQDITDAVTIEATSIKTDIIMGDTDKTDIYTFGDTVKTDIDSIGDTDKTDIYTIGDTVKTDIEKFEDTSKTDIETIGDRDKTDIGTMENIVKTDKDKVGDTDKTDIDTIADTIKTDTTTIGDTDNMDINTIGDIIKTDINKIEDTSKTELITNGDTSVGTDVNTIKETELKTEIKTEKQNNNEDIITSITEDTCTKEKIKKN